MKFLTAVVVVDIQKDFTTAYKGSLAVNGTDQTYLKSASEATKKLKGVGLPIYATQDWHPVDHVSFASNHKDKKPLETITLEDGRTQILLPDHCVQGTEGAKLLLVRNRNPGPQGQVRVQLALPSEQPICYNQDLSCPNNLNQGVTNESIS